MNEISPDQPGDVNGPASQPAPSGPTYAELSQQLADCQSQLGQVETTLSEAWRIVADKTQLATERVNLLRQERELNELKSNFVTLASHEFRTPMMTIMSSASLIGQYNGVADNDKRERHVQRIKSAVNSLTNMLNNFLFINQIDQDEQSGIPQPLNIISLAQEIITDLPPLTKPHQRFHYEHLAGSPVFRLDRPMLKHILLNLLTNASKYSAEDTDTYLTTSVSDAALTLTVRDQGIGIPDVDKDKLFINFFRARNATHIHGTGLGLYLVKRYVDRLAGSITFTSTLEEGTVFTVLLPIVAELL